MIKPVIFLVALAPLFAACATKSESATAAEEPRPGTLAYDHDVFQSLLEDHALIRREVREIDGGVEAVTESDNPEVAARIADHVLAMKSRLETGRTVRVWDPIFAAMFENADKVRFEVFRTEKGVRITETSDDPYVAQLIREHAKVVSGFVANGFDESAKAHPVPARP